MALFGRVGRGDVTPEALLLAVMGLGCGLSPLAGGFYDASVWQPIAIGVVTALLAITLGRPRMPRGWAAVVLLGLIAIWLLAYLSTIWAPGKDDALTDANRWLLYAAWFACLLALLRDRRAAILLLGTIVLGVVAIALYVIVRLLGPHGTGLLLVGRLDQPLGYEGGEAALLLMAVWLLIAVVEQRRRGWSAAAAGAAVLLLSLAVLAQSRAAIVAAGVSVLAIIALVPGRRGRTWALTAVAAGLLITAPALIAVYGARDHHPSEATLRDAVIRTLLASLAVAAVWEALDASVRSLNTRPHLRRRLDYVARWWPVGVALVVVAALAIKSPTLVRDARRAYHQFVNLNYPPPSPRLLSGDGNRADYWRVAVLEFRRHPLLGVGAGNYDVGYYLLRHTQEDVLQPHSIEFELLAELGILGALALIAFLVGVLGGLVRGAQRAATDQTERSLVVAAGGAFVCWFAYSSVDWIHRIPGVTGVALAAAAILVVPWSARRQTLGLRRPVRLLLSAGATALMLFLAVTVARQMLGDHLRTEAEQLLFSHHPQAAIARTKESLRLDDQSLPTYYVEAAAYARLDDYAAARATLEQALAKDPRELTTWGLLGDLAVRHGDYRLARIDYRHAAALDPLDPVLHSLATGPLPASAY